ncbi:MAG: hypothetical protein O7D91_15510 [Planctomycetota bacterium]|nr:hypothetical protein [Planctomycetota bacterium]
MAILLAERGVGRQSWAKRMSYHVGVATGGHFTPGHVIDTTRKPVWAAPTAHNTHQ